MKNWFLQRDFRIWLSYLMSVIISFVVVLHSFNYLRNFFTDHIFLLISVVAVIEIAYISLPYIATMNRKKQWWLDLTLIGLLFFLSVIPATLQTTDGFLREQTANIIEEPIAPQKSVLIGNYKSQLVEISKQIDSNLETIKIMVERNFLTKSLQVSKQNEKLTDKTKELLQEVSKLEQEYIRQKNDYNRKLQKFNVKQKKVAFNSFFDWLKLLWSFLLISILQLVNGRFMFHGTQIMQQPAEKIDGLINTKELLRPDELLSRFKVTGIGLTTVSKFLDRFEIWNDENLEAFVNAEDSPEKIKREFPPDTAKRLVRLCAVIQRKLPIEGKENERIFRLLNGKERLKSIGKSLFKSKDNKERKTSIENA